MKPEFPLISIYKNQGLEIFNDDSFFRRVTTFHFISQNTTKNGFYDRYGKLWNLRLINDKIKNDFKTKLLAQIFNPMVSVDLDWKQSGDYTIKELKTAINICIDMDDDVITQFEEADIIKNELEGCLTFDEIISILNKYVFEVNEEKLWEEQETREKNNLRSASGRTTRDE